MQKTLAIILAAGRGSRMLELTEDKPKCLLELAGKPLLQWQMEALGKAGVKHILLMCGYKAEMLRPENLAWDYKDMHIYTANNPHWHSSNMLRTLLCAQEHVHKAFLEGAQSVLVCYADIVYNFNHIRKLLACTQDMALTYDTCWEDLWRLRFGDPLLDAESFTQSQGFLQDIGNKPKSLAEIHGQYMGLLRFSAKGWQKLLHICACMEEQQAGSVNATDMTSFLRSLLQQGIPIGAVPVTAKWCEADNQDDIRAYTAKLDQESWIHDWR